MLKRSLAVLFFCIPSIVACNSTKEDLSLKDGKYFIKSLDTNVQQKNLQQQIDSPIQLKQKCNYDYRVGSLSATFSNNANVTKHVFGSSWNNHVKIFSEPTFTKNGFVILNDQGEISIIQSENNQIKKRWPILNKKTFCSNLSTAEKDNLVVFSCGTNIVSGFDLESGKKLWETELDMHIGSKPLFVEDDKVVVFSKCDAAYALDAKSGELLWFVPSVVSTKNQRIVETKPLLFKQHVIQQTSDDQIRAINIKDGSIDWIVSIFNTKEYVKGKEFLQSYGNMTFDEVTEELYLVNSDGFVVKIKVGNDKPEWMLPMIVSKPLWLINDRILMINDVGTISAISKKDGSVLWSNNLIEKVKQKSEKKSLFENTDAYNDITFSAPIVVDNKILVISSDNRAILVSVESGKVLEIKQYKTNIFGQPTLHNGKIYVLLNNGNALVEL